MSRERRSKECCGTSGENQCWDNNSWGCISSEASTNLTGTQIDYDGNPFIAVLFLILSLGHGVVNNVKWGDVIVFLGDRNIKPLI
jgi:hypothetical protein